VHGHRVRQRVYGAFHTSVRHADRSGRYQRELCCSHTSLSETSDENSRAHPDPTDFYAAYGAAFTEDAGRRRQVGCAAHGLPGSRD